MRRGGRLILLLGILIAALVAVGVIFFLQQGSAQTSSTGLQLPTAEPKRRVVVARVDIPRNTLLTDTVALLDTVDIAESQYNEQATQYFTNAAELAGKVTIGAIIATKPILTTDVTDAGLSVQLPPAAQGQPRTKAISLLVNNLTGVADEIKPGDFVDVLSSFQVQRTYLRPGFNEQGQIRFVEEQFSGLTTKSLIQNVQVLRIKRPEVAPVGTGTPTAQAGDLDASGQPVQQTDQSQPATGSAAASPANGSSITPGSWLLVLAMTDQQAEVLKFSREQGTGITLVLRGRGDSAIENTRGATLDILVSSFGLPLPIPAEPAVSAPNALTPLPTTTPEPTPTP